ncbi:hypothetical protein BESB_017690 [Besnoitia besnoiti]|uniref:Uncharacterized protein n=1 Tax=Besnoitia besnoiti TaxID=94643 RepID=A0A2A9M837_BESBE|nr:hypothetical protein BESB_017690 [Besnoitia besnoiti]PFH32451.1 hypothetical protein BESB_017690 [Besnoitia besnoiti]
MAPGTKSESRTMPALRLALCGEGNSVASWWAPMLLQSPAFEVVAAWSRDKSEALGIAAALSLNQNRVQAYWEKTSDLSSIGKSSGSASEANEAGDADLDALLQRQDVDAFLLVLPEDSHVIILGQLFQRCRQKHVFSANLPSFNQSIMKHLIALHNGGSSCPRQSSKTKEGRTGVWSVCNVFKHEVAVAKLQAVLKDLGTIVAGELIASSMVQGVTVTTAGSFGGKRVPQTATQQRELLTAVCSAYSGLLRHVLGDLNSLSAVRGTNATLCGQMHFQRGANVAVTVDLLSKSHVFSLTVWGLKGFGRLSWSEDKKAFEVQRYLHHYEHPTLHPVTGPTWAVKQWIETVWDVSKGGDKESNPQKPDFMLVDLVTSSAMVESDGVFVRLCATPQGRTESGIFDQVTSSRGEKKELLAAA